MADPAEAKPAPPVRDRADARLALFIGGLVLALIAGFGLGRTAAQDSGGGVGSGGAGQPGGHTHNHGGHTHVDTGGTGDQVGGFSLSAGGYTLVPEPVTAGEFRFRVDGPDGTPVTSYAVVHDKPMHLIVVRRDLSGYQHLHPTMDPDGTWRVDLTLDAPGVYRAYADFAVIGANGAQTALTLGTDLTVAGGYEPSPLPAPAQESTVDGFTVGYEGTPRVGVTQPLLFRVSADGAPVTNLERYLGAYGHLVVLREGDLGYVHVHPEEQLVDGAIKFWLAVPSPGRYRMFLDFQVGGTVRTAEFTLEIPYRNP